MASAAVLTAGWILGWQAEPDCEQLDQHWSMTTVTGWQMSLSTLLATARCDGHTHHCTDRQNFKQTLSSTRITTFLQVQGDLNVFPKTEAPLLCSTHKIEDEFLWSSNKRDWLSNIGTGISASKTDFKQKFYVDHYYRRATVVVQYLRVPLCKNYMHFYNLNILLYLLMYMLCASPFWLL